MSLIHLRGLVILLLGESGREGLFGYIVRILCDLPLFLLLHLLLLLFHHMPCVLGQRLEVLRFVTFAILIWLTFGQLRYLFRWLLRCWTFTLLLVLLLHSLGVLVPQKSLVVYLIARLRLVRHDIVLGVCCSGTARIVLGAEFMLRSLMSRRSTDVRQLELPCIQGSLPHRIIEGRRIPVFRFEFCCHLPRLQIEMHGFIHCQIVLSHWKQILRNAIICSKVRVFRHVVVIRNLRLRPVASI